MRSTLGQVFRPTAACADIAPRGHAISVAHSTAAIIFPGGAVRASVYAPTMRVVDQLLHRKPL